VAVLAIREGEEGSAINQEESSAESRAQISCPSNATALTHVRPTFTPMTDVKLDPGSPATAESDRSIDRSGDMDNTQEEKKKKERKRSSRRQIYIHSRGQETLFRPSLDKTASTKGKVTSNRTVIREQCFSPDSSINQRLSPRIDIDAATLCVSSKPTAPVLVFDWFLAPRRLPRKKFSMKLMNFRRHFPNA